MFKFKIEELVEIKLTGEIGMIVDFYKHFPDDLVEAEAMVSLNTDEMGNKFEKIYKVRVHDYSVKEFSEFELGKRN